MTEDSPADAPSPKIDTTVPHSARIWNYWLGGKDNFEVDREVGDEDRKVVESTDDDVPLDTSEGVDLSMTSDTPGLWMRRRLREVLRS